MANLKTDRQKYNREYRLKNRDKINATWRKWAKANPDKMNATYRRWYEIHRNHINQKRKEYRSRKGTSLEKRLNTSISVGIYNSLKKRKNGHHWENLVGYTLDQLKECLENKFQSDMSWNNYGKWHIDHIIPISLWLFENPENKEFKQCWALANLQPLWAKENIKKGRNVYL